MNFNAFILFIQFLLTIDIKYLYIRLSFSWISKYAQ